MFKKLIKLVLVLAIVGGILSLFGDDESDQATRTTTAPDEEAPIVQPKPVVKEAAKVDYRMALSVSVTSQFSAEFTVETNIPLPVEIMAGFDLKGQNPTDIYIGYSEKVKLVTSKQSFTIDANKQKDKLPAGDYIAEVTFYPRWGAKGGNPKAEQIKDKISASAEIALRGSGESTDDAVKRNEMQKWVMENVIVGTKWEERDFVKRLG